MRRKLPQNPTVKDVIENSEIRFYLQNLVSMMLLPDLEESKRLIDTAEFVGLQEHMDESLTLLHKTLKWKKNDIGVSKRLNSAPKTQLSIESEFTSEIKADLRTLLAWEYELYEYCERQWKVKK